MPVADGTNFDNGEFNLSAGQSVIGSVSFELPPSASVASVQWTAGLDAGRSRSGAK
jgi:hypothetical protein